MRIPVPEDYPKDHILVAGREDYHYPEADVQVDADRARTLQIRRDEEGRYCGTAAHAEAVADHLGVELPTTSDGDDVEDDSTPDAEDVEGDTTTDGEDSTSLVEDARDDHWRSVVEDVKAGEYDGVLDSLQAHDDRESVTSAVEERREELSGDGE